MTLAGRLLCVLALVAGLAGAEDPPAAPAARPPVMLLRIDGAIGPATADHVQRGLQRAAEQHAALFVLELDTPGGLDQSMRSIIKAILASSVPVATFVAPQGARAASAGTYILYASHIAAMAPATTLGAATPVAIGMPAPGQGPAETAPRPAGPASAASARSEPATRDTMEAKRISDAAAYIRGLALLRERNAEWAEQAVREAVSLPAGEALERKVIDLVAADTDELLRKLDGRVVRVQGRELTLATAGAAVVPFDVGWRGKLLAVIGDPSIALLLMMIGVYGLLFEFMSPGFVAPGVIGGVCLLLGLFGLQMLPVNYAGLALILLGIALLVGEAFMPSFGVLGLGGVAAFAFGAVMLIDDEVPGFGIPLSFIAGLSAVSAAVVLGIAGMAAKARSRPQVAGDAALLGARGELIEWDGGEGWASVRGERWKVRAAGTLRPGQPVRVTRIDGLTLEVAPLADVEAQRAGTP